VILGPSERPGLGRLAIFCGVSEPANDNAAPPFRLHRGEALRLLSDMPSNSVDLVCTDPPYSSGGLHLSQRTQSTNDKYQSTGTQMERPEFAGDSRDQRSFMFWLTLVLTECVRVLKPGAPLLVFTDLRQIGATVDAVQAGGATYRSLVVWNKGPASRPRMGGFRNQAEFIVCGTKGKIEMTLAQQVGCLPGVFTVPVTRAEKRFHITAKPVALMTELVKVCPVGGVVLDPFMGSGSTGVAALRTGRRFVGFEMVDEIADVAERRIRETVPHPAAIAGHPLVTSACNGEAGEAAATTSTGCA
jgi:site-specific DNA-methyltransferase (adenine-specific)